MRHSVDREWGGGDVHDHHRADPQLEQLRRLDAWLSELTVWQRYLLALPLVLIPAGILVWLDWLLPVVDPNVMRFYR